ncbi:uncharacterized protein [Dendropsophus ebraccatus]|uniref:uncharacterized protein n=1 Tax=Dendropsophus ebraccatus TaxID=150705 RepID=UPI0038313E17
MTHQWHAGSWDVLSGIWLPGDSWHSVWMLSGFKEQRSKMEDEEIGRRGQKRRRDVHDASDDEETSRGEKTRRDVIDSSKDEETSRGQKRRRDVIDPSKDEETSMKKRRIGPGPEIIWVRHHEDQEEEGHREDEVIPILDSSKKKISASKKEEKVKEDPKDPGDSGARPSYPGSTISENIKRLAFHHVLGRGSFGRVRTQNNVEPLL